MFQKKHCVLVAVKSRFREIVTFCSKNHMRHYVHHEQNAHESVL
jgi:hypothetical protein